MSVANSIQQLLQGVADGTSHKLDEDQLLKLSLAISKAVGRGLEARRSGPRNKKAIYFSELGSPCWRKTWYNYHGYMGEQLPASALLKFLYGDILEELMLFLAEQAGHEVTHQQGEMEIDLDNGWVLRGHIDALIDGVLTDVKSASTYAMKKFNSLGDLRKDDAFGYEDQLMGYATAMGASIASFLAVDKTLGHVVQLDVPVQGNTGEVLKNKAIQLSKALDQDTPPAKMLGWEQPEGKSGNMKLCITCSYCAFKDSCHKDVNGGKGIRTFISSKGPVFLTEVKREPKMNEVT